MAVLERVLDLRMRAHEIHGSNIANANVPGFKAKKIDFEDRMREAVDALGQEGRPLLDRETEVKAKISDVQPDTYEDPLAPKNGDGNTVNAEREQTEIAKNTIAYETAVQLINKKFALQKYILVEGAR
jgi:flagellar basal-body rod protein FlgB